MKTKLLKKVRKEYSIELYPIGSFIYNHRVKHPTYVLRCSSYPYFFRSVVLNSSDKINVDSKEIKFSEKDCINYLKSLIIRHLTEVRNFNRKKSKTKYIWP